MLLCCHSTEHAQYFSILLHLDTESFYCYLNHSNKNWSMYRFLVFFQLATRIAVYYSREMELYIYI